MRWVGSGELRLGADGVGAHGAVGGDQRGGVRDAPERAATGPDTFAAEIAVRGRGDRSEAVDDVGIISGDVARLADVGLEVVQFAFGQVEFPRSGANRLEHEAAVVKEGVARVRLGVALQDRGLIDAIETAARGQRRAGERGKGG